MSDKPRWMTAAEFRRLKARAAPTQEARPALESADPWAGAELISSYSRAQAIEDGVLVDLSANFSDLVRDAGIRYPAACTATVFAQYIEVPQGVEAQDIKGRAWDILWMYRTAARHSKGNTLVFKLYVRNHNREELTSSDLVKLKAVCGPGDTPEPCITIMLPEED